METSFSRVMEFISESNRIEREYSNEAMIDAMHAWAYLHDQCIWNRNPLTSDILLEAHKIMTVNLFEGEKKKYSGVYRDIPVYIAGRKCEVIDLEERTSSVLKAINDYKFIDGKPVGGFSVEVKEEFVKNLHVEFEHVHPFVDGNGRIGRMIYNINRLLFGLPIHIIHTGEEQMDYYKWF